MTLRHPLWRQEPGKATRTLEVRGRQICSCEGKGCGRCRYRGWIINTDAVQEEWHGGGERIEDGETGLSSIP